MTLPLIYDRVWVCYMISDEQSLSKAVLDHHLFLAFCVQCGLDIDRSFFFFFFALFFFSLVGSHLMVCLHPLLSIGHSICSPFLLANSCHGFGSFPQLFRLDSHHFSRRFFFVFSVFISSDARASGLFDIFPFPVRQGGLIIQANGICCCHDTHISVEGFSSSTLVTT